MRFCRYIILDIFIIISINSFGQASSSQNYIMTNTVKQSGITNEGQVPGLIIPSQGKSQSIAYFDGLGRPLQTVVTQGSPTNKDMVAPVVYDEFGREEKKYLPYVELNNQATPGSLKTTWTSSQTGFYNGQLGGVEADAYPYSQAVFEASPLNRVIKSFAPGISWAGSKGTATEHAVQQQYLVNTATEGVRIFNISYTPGSLPTLPATGPTVYQDGQLFKNVSIDQRGKQVIEYKDKGGQVILKKVQLGDAPGADHSGWLCTYYVYDDLNNLRFVIPPKAVDKYLANTSLADLADGMCFRYEYDYRNRMILKKVPDAGVVYMIYDLRDRLVYTQDANLNVTHQWMTTLYDELNRPIVTGLTTYAGTRDQLQTIVNQSTGTGNRAISTALPTPQNLSLGQREIKPVYKAVTSISFENGFTSEANAEFTTDLGPGNASSSTNIVDNPLPPGDNFIALTFTYYDDYSWISSTYNPSFNTKLTNGGNPNAEALPSTAAQQQRNTRGMVTGTKVRVLQGQDYSAGNFLSTVSYYDHKGRIIQTQAENFKGGIDIASTQYDFSGKVLSSYLSHNNLASVDGKQGVLTTMKYDAGDRVLEITKALYDKDGSTATSSALIAKNEYNELGQLLKKTLDPNTNTGLEKLNYEYNIRGWLLGVNRAFTRDANNTSNYFGFDLGYDKTNNNLAGGQQYAAAQYNGNIAGTVWKSKGDLAIRKYDFTYDAANRLKTADFNQYSSNTFNRTAGLDFSVNGLDYDQNGNIKSMNQMGWKLGSAPVQVDQLTYSYYDNSNRLRNVKDGMNVTDSKLGDFRSSALNPNTTAKANASTPELLAAITDYSYDANGNMVKDLNKDIDDEAGGGIFYNYLNLPWKIAVKTSQSGSPSLPKGTITYIYDAAGNKLEKLTEEKALQANNNTAKTTTTDYVSGFVYENNALQFLGQEEGRIRRILNEAGAVQYVFDYMLKDHLGNIRSVITNEQRMDKYPKATMEPSTSANELLYYSDKIVSTRMPKAEVNGYPADPSTEPDANDYVSKVVGNGNKTGPGITLKVMAGDKLTIRVSSWWKAGAVTDAGSPQTPATELLGALAAGLGGVAGSHGSMADLSSGTVLNPGINDFLTFKNPAPANGKPKAFLNWILFDEQFKYVEGSSGAEAVAPDGAFKLHLQDNLPINKSGYLYVYVSNESPNIPVFFDNLQVTHTRGALLEEAHYYPFGLAMSGISSKALNFGGSENKYKYNCHEIQNKEFTDNSGLEFYDYGARMQDPQLGRFWQIDPKCEIFQHYTPYNYCFNNPMLFVDPDGMLAKYNWDDGKYYDEGKEVSFDQVQQQYQIGDYAKTTSVMVAAEFESDGKTMKNDYGTHALETIVNAAVKTGNIRVLHVKDANDAANQIEGINATITNLFFLSHGDAKNPPHRAYFAIGLQNFHTEDVLKSSALSRIANKLASTPGPLPSAAEVIVFACGAGGVQNGGAEMLKAIAKKLHATVYGPQGFGVSSSSIFNNAIGDQNYRPGGHDPAAFSNAFKNQGNWTKAYEFGINQVSQTINNVYFDAFGRIHYSQ